MNLLDDNFLDLQFNLKNDSYGPYKESSNGKLVMT